MLHSPRVQGRRSGPRREGSCTSLSPAFNKQFSAIRAAPVERGRRAHEDPGGCSARKAAGPGRRWPNTGKPCETLSVYSSSAITVKIFE